MTTSTLHIYECIYNSVLLTILLQEPCVGTYWRENILLESRVFLQEIEKFKRFHFKEPNFGIDARHQVGNFGTIQHGGGIIGTFQQRNALVIFFLP
jgi:hypothetical protein